MPLATEQEIFTANVNSFVGAYVARNWDYMKVFYSRDEVVEVINEVTNAAIEAATKEAERWPADEANVEAMHGMGRDFVPSIGG